MAIFKSGIITKRDDKAKQIDRSEQNVERVAISQVTLSGAIANNDIIFLAEIPVDARITSIRNWTDDLGTTGTLNLGFYKGTVNTTSATDADAVDEDALATAIDVNAAATNDVELRFEVQDINTVAKTAWELAGLTTRPDYNTFLVAFTAAAATTAGGDISTVIRYVH